MDGYRNKTSYAYYYGFELGNSFCCSNKVEFLNYQHHDAKLYVYSFNT